MIVKKVKCSVCILTYSYWDKNAKVLYPFSPVLLPFSLPPYFLPDLTPATQAKPFDERRYLGKTLQRLVCILKKHSLQRVQDRPLNGSFLSTIYLLLVSLFPTVGHTKTAGDSSSSKNTLLRFIM